MYEDETGELSAYVTNGRLFSHVELFGEPTLSNFKHWKSVLAVYEDELRSRGFTEYYALVDSLDKFRWCEFLGMQTNYEVIGDTIEIMIKEI